MAIFLLNSGILDLDRNQWLLAVFGFYLSVIVIFAVVYYRIYKIYPLSFAFNSDILNRQLELSKVSFEQEIHSILFKLDALKNLLEEVEQHPEYAEVKRDFLGGQAVIHTSKYTFKVTLEAVPGMFLPTPISTLSIHDLNGHEIARQDLGLLPVVVEEYREIAQDLVKRLGKSLTNYRRKLGTLTGDWPEVWSFWDFLYFSTITQTTVGYGDMLPNRTVVRIVVIAQILVGLLILGFVINIVFH